MTERQSAHDRPHGRSQDVTGDAGRLVVGRVGRAHGIRGELTIEVRTDDPESRFGSGAVLFTDPSARGPLTVESARWHSGRLLLGFENVVDRDGAEALRGTLLLADVMADVAPEDPEEFYDHQLIGLAVVTTGGEPVGEVHEMVHLPAQDLIAIRRHDGGEALVPFVAALVPTIDLAGGRVVIDPPPGLLDLGEAG